MLVDLHIWSNDGSARLENPDGHTMDTHAMLEKHDVDVAHTSLGHQHDSIGREAKIGMMWEGWGGVDVHCANNWSEEGRSNPIRNNEEGKNKREH